VCVQSGFSNPLLAKFTLQDIDIDIDIDQDIDLVVVPLMRSRPSRWPPDALQDASSGSRVP
jgi:hypothetical protein